jgi:hypothetical protein
MGAHGAASKVNRHPSPGEGLFKMRAILLRRPQQHGHAVKRQTLSRESEYSAGDLYAFPVFALRREDEYLIVG